MSVSLKVKAPNLDALQKKLSAKPPAGVVAPPPTSMMSFAPAPKARSGGVMPKPIKRFK